MTDTEIRTLQRRFNGWANKLFLLAFVVATGVALVAAFLEPMAWYWKGTTISVALFVWGLILYSLAKAPLWKD